MSVKINYNKFVNEIIDIIYGNNQNDYSSNEKYSNLGKQIYSIDGPRSISTVISLIENKFIQGEYNNEYLGHLANIEKVFNKVC